MPAAAPSLCGYALSLALDGLGHHFDRSGSLEDRALVKLKPLDALAIVPVLCEVLLHTDGGEGKRAQLADDDGETKNELAETAAAKRLVGGWELEIALRVIESASDISLVAQRALVRAKRNVREAEERLVALGDKGKRKLEDALASLAAIAEGGDGALPDADDEDGNTAEEEEDPVEDSKVDSVVVEEGGGGGVDKTNSKKMKKRADSKKKTEGGATETATKKKKKKSKLEIEQGKFIAARHALDAAQDDADTAVSAADASVAAFRSIMEATKDDEAIIGWALRGCLPEVKTLHSVGSLWSGTDVASKCHRRPLASSSGEKEKKISIIGVFGSSPSSFLLARSIFMDVAVTTQATAPSVVFATAEEVGYAVIPNIVAPAVVVMKGSVILQSFAAPGWNQNRDVDDFIPTSKHHELLRGQLLPFLNQAVRAAAVAEGEGGGLHGGTQDDVFLSKALMLRGRSSAGAPLRRVLAIAGLFSSLFGRLSNIDAYNVGYRGHMGKTALMMIVDAGDTDAASTILAEARARGATRRGIGQDSFSKEHEELGAAGMDLSASDLNGRTVLHAAAACQDAVLERLTRSEAMQATATAATSAASDGAVGDVDGKAATRMRSDSPAFHPGGSSPSSAVAVSAVDRSAREASREIPAEMTALLLDQLEHDESLDRAAVIVKAVSALDSRTARGLTPLMVAARHHDVRAVGLIIDKLLTLHKLTREGVNASTKDRAAVVQQVDANGRTALSHCLLTFVDDRPGSSSDATEVVDGVGGETGEMGETNESWRRSAEEVRLAKEKKEEAETKERERGGLVGVIRLLMDEGPPSPLDGLHPIRDLAVTADASGDTPLHLALQRDDVAGLLDDTPLGELLDRWVDAADRIPLGRRALLCRLPLDGLVVAVSALLSAGHGKAGEETAAFLAAFGRLDGLLRIGCSPNRSLPRRRGGTAMHLSTGARLTEALVQGGGDWRARDDGGNTAMHVAAAAGNKPVCDALLDAGAEFSSRTVINNDGKTPLDVAVGEAKVLLEKEAADRRKQHEEQIAKQLARLANRKSTAQELLGLSRDDKCREVEKELARLRGLEDGDGDEDGGDEQEGKTGVKDDGLEGEKKNPDGDAEGGGESKTASISATGSGEGKEGKEEGEKEASGLDDFLDMFEDAVPAASSRKNKSKGKNKQASTMKSSASGLSHRVFESYASLTWDVNMTLAALETLFDMDIEMRELTLRAMYGVASTGGAGDGLDTCAAVGLLAALANDSLNRATRGRAGLQGGGGHGGGRDDDDDDRTQGQLYWTPLAPPPMGGAVTDSSSGARLVEAGMVWERAVTYSSRCKGYTEVIRVWSIEIGGEDQLSRLQTVVKSIEESASLGRQSTRRVLLRNLDTSRRSASQGGVLGSPPRTYGKSSDESGADVVCCPVAFRNGDAPALVTFFELNDELARCALSVKVAGDGSGGDGDATGKTTEGKSGGGAGGSGGGDEKVLVRQSPELPFLLDEDEDVLTHQNLRGEESTLLIGRSGTGKTTICLQRIWSAYEVDQASDRAQRIRQRGWGGGAGSAGEDDGGGVVAGGKQGKQGEEQPVEQLSQVFVTCNGSLRDGVERSFRGLQHHMADDDSIDHRGIVGGGDGGGSAGSGGSKGGEGGLSATSNPSSLSDFSSRHLSASFQERLSLVGRSCEGGVVFFTRLELLCVMERMAPTPFFRCQPGNDDDLKAILDWASGATGGGVLVADESKKDKSKQGTRAAKSAAAALAGVGGRAHEGGGREGAVRPGNMLDFRGFLSHVWPALLPLCKIEMSASIAYKEIMNVKASSAALDQPKGHLTRPQYLALPQKLSPQFRPQRGSAHTMDSLRSQAYDLFLKYESVCRHKGMWDLPDLVWHIHAHTNLVTSLGGEGHYVSSGGGGGSLLVLARTATGTATMSGGSDGNGYRKHVSTNDNERERFGAKNDARAGRLNSINSIKVAFASALRIGRLSVDEVQDFSQAELRLLLSLCPDKNKVFLAGDTCQTIARGVGFRFEDLRSLFYAESQAEKAGAALSPKAVVGAKGASGGAMAAARRPDTQVPPVLQLSTNYRTHDGILRGAAFVVETLIRMFPASVDRLRPEQGAFAGPLPILLPDTTEQELSRLLRGVTGKADAGGAGVADDALAAAVEFGAHQAVLVRSREAREELPLDLGEALALTVIQSKGLEFDDVIIFNFFADSLATPGDWRALLTDVSKQAGAGATKGRVGVTGRADSIGAEGKGDDGGGSDDDDDNSSSDEEDGGKALPRKKAGEDEGGRGAADLKRGILSLLGLRAKTVTAMGHHPSDLRPLHFDPQKHMIVCEVRRETGLCGCGCECVRACAGGGLRGREKRDEEGKIGRD